MAVPLMNVYCGMVPACPAGGAVPDTPAVPPVPDCGSSAGAHAHVGAAE